MDDGGQVGGAAGANWREWKSHTFENGLGPNGYVVTLIFIPLSSLASLLYQYFSKPKAAHIILPKSISHQECTNATLTL